MTTSNSPASQPRKIRLRIVEPDGSRREILVSGPLVRMGRNADCEVAFDPGRFPKVSGQHCELDMTDASVTLRHRSGSNKTILNDSPIAGDAAVGIGDEIRLGFTGPLIKILALEAANKSSDLSNRTTGEPPATQMAQDFAHILSGSMIPKSFKLGRGGRIGRDVKSAEFVLDHPHVSRRHARIDLKGNDFVLSDEGSSNGTFVNGDRLTKSRLLQTGDVVDIGPYSLRFSGTALESQSRSNNIQLVVSGVTRVVEDTSRRRRQVLLQDVTLVLNPGEFLCVLGPSGSGKSTLLSLISGRTSPSAGSVTINGRDLHENFAAIKEDVAVMPQSVSLHEGLTVDQTLGYVAALRLPPDTGATELQKSVNTVLESVGLTQRRSLKIKQLSGGQLKRAGLAGELISGPSLLFLDEVTSGLDEQADGDMMRLFRSLADDGKTLVCVTHNLARVGDNCHLVAILTVGGRLAFYGSPQDALRYFQVTSLADIYTELATRTPEQWANAFAQSKHYQAKIKSRLPKSVLPKARSRSNPLALPLGTWFRQWIVLVRRYMAVLRGDLLALLTLFGQSLLVTLLICLVFDSVQAEIGDEPSARIVQQNKIRNLLFLVGVSAFWLGCNNCVKEIVKERRIFERERDFNLIPEAFLASKLSVLGVIGFIQSMMLGSIVYTWCELPGPITGQLVNLLALSIAGSCLGLAISAITKTEEVAVAAVPLVVIPQIILAGVVAVLGQFAHWISSLVITVYWGQKLAESTLPESSRIAADYQPSPMFCLTIILLHAAIFLAIAWTGVRRRIKER